LRPHRLPHASISLATILLACAALAHSSPRPRQTNPLPANQANALELSRTIRPWEFLSAVGTEAGLFGNESGTVEAWVYPLKILRDFHLRFHTDARVIEAASLARTITARPESVTILYTGDTFNIRETFFVPVAEQGAIIKLEIETEHPLEVEALFQRDLQLEWPAGLGSAYGYWDAPRNAFYFGEETKKFVALVGSPSAVDEQVAYETNYSSSDQNGFRLGATQKGQETKLIVIAASVNGPADADNTFKHLLADSDALLKSSAGYYRDYLARTVSLNLPDKQLQQAYDWSRISELQGIVKNPYLGTGIVAGYRTSASGQRPGFAWFFGRDSMWTSLAFDAVGDFASTRTALDFLSKVQRADGKIPHEIAQTASLVPWFTADYPYAFASADATPLYIIAMNDYVTESGDADFLAQHMGSVMKAYDFLRSTWDSQGLPQNFGIGHGWVEGGPLLPVKTELYQSALGLEAVRALSHLVAIGQIHSQSDEFVKLFEKQKAFLNDAFWLPETKRFAFALDQADKKIDEPTVLATVPMWFGLLDQDKANAMIDELAKPAHQTDWGMRIIANDSAKYSAGGYHFGAVWPLFTGWASVGEYRYHRAAPAYANLRANALLALDGALGHTTEVLSGDYYSSLSTSSPHQIWSAAMIVNPILRGLLGLQTDALQKTLTFTPHIPAEWTSLRIENIHINDDVLLLNYTRSDDGILIEAGLTSGSSPISVEFHPSLSPRAKVQKVALNGKPLPFHIEAHGEDQHVVVSFPVSKGKYFLRIHMSHDFGLTVHSVLPELGSAGRGLRILSETWSSSGDKLTLEVSGIAGQDYGVRLWNSSEVKSIDGGDFNPTSQDWPLSISFPENGSTIYSRKTVVLHFEK
jgi:glycogen debranching enzyme